MTAQLKSHSVGQTLVLTLSNPQARNALGPAMYSAGIEALNAAETNPDIRSIILTGEGEHFSAGGQVQRLQENRAHPPEHQAQSIEALHAWIETIATFPKPVLAAVEGAAAGAGFSLALACDFRLGIKGMRFFMPAARFGLHYYPSGLRRYTQKVSPSFAKRAFILSEDFTDTELLHVGYLDWLVERADFARKVDEVAAKLAGLAPLSMSNMKRAIEQYNKTV